MAKEYLNMKNIIEKFTLAWLAILIVDGSYGISALFA
jgi:hypothetical protein